MNYEQYNQLDEAAQISLLLTQGVNLKLVRSTKELIIQLYAMNGFYVELFFKKTSSLPFQIKAFEQMQHLDVYLHAIDLSSLYATG